MISQSHDYVKTSELPPKPVFHVLRCFITWVKVTMSSKTIYEVPLPLQNAKQFAFHSVKEIKLINWIGFE